MRRRNFMRMLAGATVAAAMELNGLRLAPPTAAQLNAQWLKAIAILEASSQEMLALKHAGAAGAMFLKSRIKEVGFARSILAGKESN